jgi:hypothetical protein
MQDSKAAAPMLPKSRRGVAQSAPPVPVGLVEAR